MLAGDADEDPKRKRPDKPSTPAETQIDVTIAIAGYNCEAFLEQAVVSALAQQIALEVIIVDDASSDGTVDLAERLARKDDRVRLIRMPHNVGPAGARNAALDAARGRWFSILDADDLMHSERLGLLIGIAEAEDADLIADDMIVFDDADRRKPDRFLSRHTAGATQWISLATYLRSTRMYDNTPNLGYLKPIIRISKLRETGLRYDERLRIGEDDQFIFSMLLAGFRYRLEVLPGYYYRKHSSSISHRLSPSTMDRIATVAAQMAEKMVGRSEDEQSAFTSRARSVRRTTSFVHLLEHLKARRWGNAVREIMRNPAIIPLLQQPPLDRLKRWIARQTYRPAPSRQILVVAPHSQKAMVRSVSSEIRKYGFTPHLLLIREHPPRLIDNLMDRLARDKTALAGSYFEGKQDGRATAHGRVTLLRLGRQVERVLVMPPMPYPIEGELARSALPVTRLDHASEIRSLLAPDAKGAPSLSQLSKVT